MSLISLSPTIQWLGIRNDRERAYDAIPGLSDFRSKPAPLCGTTRTKLTAKSQTRMYQLTRIQFWCVRLRAKSLQSCLTLCNSMDYTACQALSVHGILQTRILKWVVMPSSRGSSRAQGSNPHLLFLLHWLVGFLPLVPPGKPLQFRGEG